MLLRSTLLAVAALVACPQPSDDPAPPTTEAPTTITAPPTTVDTTPTVPDCLPFELVVVAATEPTACDLDGSQVLAVRYVGSDGVEYAAHAQRCADHGGRLVWTALFSADGEFVCFAVDY